MPTSAAFLEKEKIMSQDKQETQQDFKTLKEGSPKRETFSV